MLRDKGPNHTLGFGITGNQIPIDEEVEGGNPEAGIIGKYFNERPIQKFFAVTGATIVGAVTSGALVRKGGVRLLGHAAKRARDTPNGVWDTGLKGFRDTQKVLDEMQGINRVRGSYTEVVGGKTVAFDDPTKDKLITRQGFFFTEEEKRLARTPGNEVAASWTVRDEMQQRLVRQARRLPYELPSLYVTQRTISDPLLDAGPEDRGSWLNPVDLIGDFSRESTKNLASALLPFEAGMAASKQGWRRALTMGQDEVKSPIQGAARRGVITINESLELIGHSASEIVGSTTRFSNRTAGAMAAATSETAAKQRGFLDHLYQARHGEGGVFGWMQRVAKGEEVFGIPGAMRDIARGTKTHLSGEELFPTRGSKLQQLGASVRYWRGKGEFNESRFYNTFARAEHEKYLTRHLREMGVGEEAADEFARLARTTLPSEHSTKFDLSRRVTFGQKVYADRDAYEAAFAQHIRPRLGDSADDISRVLPSALRRADSDFMLAQEVVERRAANVWRRTYEDVIGPQASSVLGQGRMPYSHFMDEVMGADTAEFLVRRSAQRAGVDMTTSSGVVRSTADLKSELRQLGLDPARKDQMRAFLVQSGDISKPWNPTGMNMFGLRSVSVQQAMDRGLFDGSEDLPFIEQIASSIKKSSVDPLALHRTRAGGLYQTSRGQIVDMNPLRSTGRGMLDAFATNVQVPLLQFNPLRMLGYDIKRSIDEQSLLQFSTGKGQPFLGREADGFLWMRTGRGKGSVAALDYGSAQFSSEMLPGTYRPLPTDANTLGGRGVRMAAGDPGRHGAEPKTWFQRTFDINPHKPDSLFGTVRRFLDRKTDLGHAPTFYRQLTTPGKGWEGTSLPGDPSLWANHADKHLRSLKHSSVGLNVARHADRRGTLGRLLYEGDEFVLGMNQKQLTDELRKASGDDEVLGRTLSKARDSLLKPWLDGAKSMSGPLPSPMVAPGMATRLDAARMDFLRFRAVKMGMERKGGFDELMQDVFEEISTMQKIGQASHREAASARLAFGDMHVTSLALRHNRGSMGNQAQTENILKRLIGSEPGVGINDQFRQVMDDAANYGTSGNIMRRVRQKMGFGEYEFSGLEVNPFGQNFALTPTFGTAFGRNPLAATGSVLGVNTWSNPQAFSGAGIGVSHIFDRMNRAFGIMNLSVDNIVGRTGSSYAGPLHMFFEGMVGKRVLPMMVAGTMFMTADRTLGGYVYNDRDAHGERIYRPMFTSIAAEGVAGVQIGLAGVTPFGKTAAEKSEEIREGDVAIRSGRWWPLGNTPFRGGNVDYFRPSWYQRLNSGYQYTSQTFGSPMERLMYGYDFSPLRPFDPYRFEEKHYYERPYPMTGDYFTGPWGPATEILNMTAGRFLKPRQMMHEDTLNYELSRFQSVGAYGMAPPSTDIAIAGEPTIYSSLSSLQGMANDGYYAAAAGGPAYLSGSGLASQHLSDHNQVYMDAAGMGGAIRTTGPQYPFVSSSETSSRRPTNVVAAVEPLNPSSLKVQGSEWLYNMQEYSGIYGFGLGALRSNLGFGSQKFDPYDPIFADASEAYGSQRQFWDLNLGGLGDFPTPLEGQYASLTLSEFVRRFVRTPRRELNMVNPIPNVMGIEHPWLPGANYFDNFKTGDPYTMVSEGEMRLPGIGYERFHGLHSDETGRYGRIDRFKILADIAPYSTEFHEAARELENSGMGAYELDIYEQTMERVRLTTNKHEFTDYKYRHSTPGEAGVNPLHWAVGNIGERFVHADSYLHTKLFPYNTAIEDWERNNVYGASFPKWQQPIESFIKPMFNKAGSRNPLHAGAMGAVMGHLFAAPQAKAAGRMIGGILGFTASAATKTREFVSGERFMPAARKREIAMEEYVDILDYTKARRGFTMAQQAGDNYVAEQFKRQMKSTMYGADLYDSSPEELERAVPKRKREHFRQFLQAPERDRERILSTAGRLERRIYQAAWGMEVERRPELGDYFEDRELPGPDWEGWDPRMDMDLVKIKMLQQQGLNASEMGYYPQQLREANLINPSYPRFDAPTRDPRARLQEIMAQRGMYGDVRAVRTPFPGVRVQVNAGVG